MRTNFPTLMIILFPLYTLLSCEEDPCPGKEFEHNLCIDEGQYEIKNTEIWHEMFRAMLQCAGIKELPEPIFVEITAETQPIYCKGRGRGLGGCYFTRYGDQRVELPATGEVLTHEVGHAIEDMYSVCDSFDTEKCTFDFSHRPCGLPVGCGNEIYEAFFVDGLRLDDYNDWSDVWPIECGNWRDD